MSKVFSRVPVLSKDIQKAEFISLARKKRALKRAESWSKLSMMVATQSGETS